MGDGDKGGIGESGKGGEYEGGGGNEAEDDEIPNGVTGGCGEVGGAVGSGVRAGVCVARREQRDGGGGVARRLREREREWPRAEPLEAAGERLPEKLQ